MTFTATYIDLTENQVEMLQPLLACILSRGWGLVTKPDCRKGGLLERGLIREGCLLERGAC